VAEEEESQGWKKGGFKQRGEIFEKLEDLAERHEGTRLSQLPVRVDATEEPAGTNQNIKG